MRTHRLCRSSSHSAFHIYAMAIAKWGLAPNYERTHETYSGQRFGSRSPSLHRWFSSPLRTSLAANKICDYNNTSLCLSLTLLFFSRCHSCVRYCTRIYSLTRNARIRMDKYGLHVCDTHTMRNARILDPYFDRYPVGLCGRFSRTHSSSRAFSLSLSLSLSPIRSAHSLAYI